MLLQSSPMYLEICNNNWYQNLTKLGFLDLLEFINSLITFISVNIVIGKQEQQCRGYFVVSYVYFVVRYFDESPFRGAS